MPTPGPTPTNTNNLAHDLTAHLTRKGLPPSPTWLTTHLPTLLARPTTPLAAIQRTALFRLLATDITTALAHSPTANRLPPSVADGRITELTVPGPVAVQVLDVEDVGRSRWAQVEALEARARGEGTRGREVVQLAAEDEDGGGGGRGEGGGPHKVLLVDAAGTRVWGFELVAVEGVGVGKMGIGAKLVLRDVVVARGVVLLEPRSVTCLGGKVEGLDKAWREGRVERLKVAAGMEE